MQELCKNGSFRNYFYKTDKYIEENRISFDINYHNYITITGSNQVLNRCTAKIYNILFINKYLT